MINRKIKNQKSFTLIELLVVIVIIGILAGVIILSVGNNINKAQDLKVSNTILSISKALKTNSYDSFPIENTACNLKNSCTNLKSKIDIPVVTEDIYYKTSSSGNFFVIYGNRPSNSFLDFEITSVDEKVKEVPSFDNLIAYYPLSSGTIDGAIISDMSSNSNNGNNAGAVFSEGIDGNIGTAMSFDGSNDYINCGAINFPGQLTISFWFRLNSLPASQPLAFPGFIGKSQSFSIESDKSTGSIKIYQMGVSAVSSNVAINDLDWHHFVLSIDNMAKYLYIDGVSVGSFPTATMQSNSNPVLIGKGWSNNIFSKISDVRFYDRGLSQSEIKALYNAHK